MKTRYPDKTTYILGAGFSVAAGIPTMSQFIPTAFKLLKRYRVKHGEESLAEALAELIAKKRAIAANTDLNLENIEHLFCLVDRELEVGSLDHMMLVLVILNTVCLAYLEHEALLQPGSGYFAQSPLFLEWNDRRAKLREDNEHPTVPQRHLFLAPGISYSGKPCGPAFNFCVYEAFLSHVLDCQSRRQSSQGPPVDSHETDAIITPNYDLVLEEKLRSFKAVQVFYGEAKNRGIVAKANDAERFAAKWPARSPNTAKGVVLPIIKIHGSVNWRYTDASNENAGWVDVWDPMKKIASNKGFATDERIPLMPPTWRKEPGKGRLFDDLAQEAIDHLRTAERIVVIGYSMPVTDLYLRALLAEGLDTPERPRIEIWDVKKRADMDEAVAYMFGKSNLSRIRFEEKGFLGYVKDKINVESLAGQAARLAAQGAF